MTNNISFITPAYNCEKTLDETVRSVLSVLEKGDEYVIVNDCSTDKTLEKLTKWKEKNSNIKIITNLKNKGGAATRNIAVLNSSNKYIFCLDSDNILDKKSFFILRKHIDDKKEILFFEKIKYFKEKFGFKFFTHEWKFKESYNVSDYFNTYKVPGSSGNYLFTKNSWEKSGGYPENAGALDTWAFGLRQTANKFSQYTVNGTFYLHRYGTESYFVRDSKNRNNMESIRYELVKEVGKMIPINIMKKVNHNKLSWFLKLKE